MYSNTDLRQQLRWWWWWMVFTSLKYLKTKPAFAFYAINAAIVLQCMNNHEVGLFYEQTKWRRLSFPITDRSVNWFYLLNIIHGEKVTPFCLRYLPPPCWRYIILRQCNVESCLRAFVRGIIHQSKYTTTANNSGMRNFRFPQIGSHTKNTSNMAAPFNCSVQWRHFQLIFQFVWSTQMSSWAMVLLTSERLISVWFPLKCKELCSRRRIVIAWTVISLSEYTITVEYHLYIRGRGHLLVAVWRQHALLLHVRPHSRGRWLCDLLGPPPVFLVLRRIGEVG